MAESGNFLGDFSGKTIALGITGSIAAYRAADLVRELYRRGAKRVVAVMTPSASDFVTPTTMTMMCREAVHTDPLAMTADGIPVHIALAQQADVYLILPATANVLAKLSQGIGDDLVTTTALTFTDKPVVICPAMNTRMWLHPLTRRNVDTLASLPNVSIVTPGAGELACGETGDGHLADPDRVMLALYRALHPSAGLYQDKAALVTAGGTWEPLDPVRGITNRSSGRMGLALADELHAMGARVTLLLGSHQLPGGMPSRPYPVVPVTSADDLRVVLDQRFSQMDLTVMAAAVSDFRSVQRPVHKLKRQEHDEVRVTLTPTPDLLAGLSERKRPDQILVGFAAESQHLLQNAREKLERKRLDLIVANDISRDDIGFNSPENEVTLLFADKTQVSLPRAPKPEIARAILCELHARRIHPDSRAVATR